MADGPPDILTPNPVGDRLKAAREAREMSLDDVANITRVPTRHLEHIDRGEWDALPAITYSVGFARAYANAVGLNGAEIGAELRGQLGTSHGNAAATAYYEPADPARVPPRSLALIAGAVALLLVIGYAIWRSSAVAEEDPQAEAAAVETPLVAPPPTAEPNAAAGQPLGGPSAGAGSGPVILTAVDDVWLRVYEAGGSVLYENILKAGERYEVPSNAQRPQIRAGRPEALKVTVGQTAVPQLGPTGQAIGDVSLLPADLLRTAPAGAAAPAPAATAPAPAPTR